MYLLTYEHVYKHEISLQVIDREMLQTYEAMHKTARFIRSIAND